MNKKAFLLLLALAATLAPAASCQCSRGQPPERRVETLVESSFRLQNGLEVDLVAGPCSDSAALVVALNAGIDHDPPARSGMAQLAARILAASAAPGRAERTVEIGNDYTLYSVVAAGDRLLDELDEVAAWMSRRVPTEDDLARGRGQVLEVLAKVKGGDPAMMAMSFAEEAVQPTRGNGKRRGIASDVQAITSNELLAFWEGHFKPSNARIAVVGRFDTEKVRTRIQSTLGAVPAGTPPVPRDPASASVRGNLVMGDAPSAVAVAVPAPPLSDPLYPPFLVLAARLLEEPSQPRGWDVSYDPIKRPELLFITGAVGQAEPPEPAAARIRAEAATILAQPPAPGDATGTQTRFRLFLEPRGLDPSLCTKDPRAFAVARVRQAQLQQDGARIKQAIGTVGKEQLDQAASLFDSKRTAAVIAGGTLR